MICCVRDRNAEALRTQSFRLSTSSALSASPRFKSFLAEKMEGLIRELATQFHESEKLQSAIRDNMQKLGFALPEVGK